MPELRRIDAAKELFNAFVTRTQAYKLHHSFGLTLFDNETTVKLNITKNTEEFEVSGSIITVEMSRLLPNLILFQS